MVGFEGFYQLAGGTNSHTVECLKKEGLFRTRAGTGRDALIGGIAYGGYARKVFTFNNAVLTFLLFYWNQYNPAIAIFYVPGMDQGSNEHR